MVTIAIVMFKMVMAMVMMAMVMVTMATCNGHDGDGNGHDGDGKGQVTIMVISDCHDQGNGDGWLCLNTRQSSNKPFSAVVHGIV